MRRSSRLREKTSKQEEQEKSERVNTTRRTEQPSRKAKESDPEQDRVDDGEDSHAKDPDTNREEEAEWAAEDDDLSSVAKPPADEESDSSGGNAREDDKEEESAGIEGEQGGAGDSERDDAEDKGTEGDEERVVLDDEEPPENDVDEKEEDDSDEHEDDGDDHEFSDQNGVDEHFSGRKRKRAFEIPVRRSARHAAQVERTKQKEKEKERERKQQQEVEEDKERLKRSSLPFRKRYLEEAKVSRGGRYNLRVAKSSENVGSGERPKPPLKRRRLSSPEPSKEAKKEEAYAIVTSRPGLRPRKLLPGDLRNQAKQWNRTIITETHPQAEGSNDEREGEDNDDEGERGDEGEGSGDAADDAENGDEDDAEAEGDEEDEEVDYDELDKEPTRVTRSLSKKAALRDVRFGRRRSRRKRTKTQRYTVSSPSKKKNLARSTDFRFGSGRRYPSYLSSSSSDEETTKDRQRDKDRHFEKIDFSRALDRAKILPINQPTPPGGIAARDKADINPVVESTVDWSCVGGLDHHIRALKEMVLLPLLYPEVFERFGISPPRGVLFYGPPGTGKTLMARALANTCSQSGTKVSFFMRKGADCLSKWVGEAERQLRLLFEQARRMEPSIIFFDEIDGLAPVRSSKQDQIHSSIVSTLLAVMDGLDNRGQVVVIGATNRIDAIDPALRRPGRFDREFLFTLPSKDARRTIFAIHSKSWVPPMEPRLAAQISDMCVGYCGADLKALCTEAALRAVRRSYPQIYDSTDKLQIDLNKLKVTKGDFLRAMKGITPSSHRSTATHALALSPIMKPLLEYHLQALLHLARKNLGAYMYDEAKKDSSDDEGDTEDEALGVPTAHEEKEKEKEREDPVPAVKSMEDIVAKYQHLYLPHPVHRPRILVHGEPELGQSEVAAALLHSLEQYPVFSLDLASLSADTVAKSLEEACVHIFTEARRKVPSIVYVPHLDAWWGMAPASLQLTYLTLMNDVPPSLPLLVLGTSDVPKQQLPTELSSLFPGSHQMCAPNAEHRKQFFANLVDDVARPPNKRKRKRRLEILPKAPPPPPRQLTPNERALQEQEDSHVLRKLRILLRECVLQLLRDRNFKTHFSKPVDEEEVPDYYSVISDPMCLEEILVHVDRGGYHTLQAFLDDVQQVVQNAVEYNAEMDPMRIVSKAKALQDYVMSWAHRIRKHQRKLILACEDVAKRVPPVPRQKQDYRNYYKNRASNNSDDPRSTASNTNGGNGNERSPSSSLASLRRSRVPERAPRVPPLRFSARLRGVSPPLRDITLIEARNRLRKQKTVTFDEENEENEENGDHEENEEKTDEKENADDSHDVSGDADEAEHHVDGDVEMEEQEKAESNDETRSKEEKDDAQHDSDDPGEDAAAEAAMKADDGRVNDRKRHSGVRRKSDARKKTIQGESADENEGGEDEVQDSDRVPPNTEAEEGGPTHNSGDEIRFLFEGEIDLPHNGPSTEDGEDALLKDKDNPEEEDAHMKDTEESDKEKEKEAEDTRKEGGDKGNEQGVAMTADDQVENESVTISQGSATNNEGSVEGGEHLEVEDEDDEEEQKSLTLDMVRLEALQIYLIRQTGGFTVDSLHALHAKLYQRIYEHRDNWDKTILLDEIQEVIDDHPCKTQTLSKDDT